MYILITYDVSTTTPAGKSRLRRTAKTCLDFDQRVQNSVFECKVDPALLVTLKARLPDVRHPPLFQNIVLTQIPARRLAVHSCFQCTLGINGLG